MTQQSDAISFAHYWIDFAIGASLDPLVVSFIDQNQHLLENAELGTTPRMWERVASMVDASTFLRDTRVVSMAFRASPSIEAPFLHHMLRMVVPTPVTLREVNVGNMPETLLQEDQMLYLVHLVLADLIKKQNKPGYDPEALSAILDNALGWVGKHGSAEMATTLLDRDERVGLPAPKGESADALAR